MNRISLLGISHDDNSSFIKGAADPWDLIEQAVGRALESGDPLICLGGDHAITHPIMRAVRRRHSPSMAGMMIQNRKVS